MSEKKETAMERLERLKREKEAAKNSETTTELVNQLTHESNGEPDFTEIAKRLQERKAQESKGENEGYVKMTIYIRKDIADSFNGLITKRGQQKEYANQALADFVAKKIRELNI